MRQLTILLFMTACSPSFGSKIGTFEGDDNSLDVNGSDEDFFTQSGLPDLRDEMDSTYCENVQPNVAGATSYFLGTYVQKTEGWVGKEQWILHPTSDWTATNGETCYVTWEVAASETDIAGCPNCDFALDVSASINRQETDCPEGLWEQEEQWTTLYDVMINGSDASFYFQSSGDLVGYGYSNSTAASFLSEVSCSWF